MISCFLPYSSDEDAAVCIDDVDVEETHHLHCNLIHHHCHSAEEEESRRRWISGQGNWWWRVTRTGRARMCAAVCVDCS